MSTYKHKLHSSTYYYLNFFSLLLITLFIFENDLLFVNENVLLLCKKNILMP
jgi:hypothetical protein